MAFFGEQPKPPSKRVKIVAPGFFVAHQTLSRGVHIGITSTRRGITYPQRLAMVGLITAWRAEGFLIAHHGDCPGGDLAFASEAQKAGYFVEAHPGPSRKFRAWHRSDKIHPPKEFLDRNRDIVDTSERMIAAPFSEEEEARSGTWSTVRYARSLSRLPPYIWIVLPDGSVRIDGELK